MKLKLIGKNHSVPSEK